MELRDKIREVKDRNQIIWNLLSKFHRDEIAGYEFLLEMEKVYSIPLAKEAFEAGESFGLDSHFEVGEAPNLDEYIKEKFKVD